VLNFLKYKGREDYTMFDVWKMTLMKGKYVSNMHIVFTYCLYIIGIITLAILYGWPYIHEIVGNGKAGVGASRRRLMSSVDEVPY